MANVTGTVKAQTNSTQALSGVPSTNTSPATVTQAFNCNFSTSGTVLDAVDLKYTATLSLAATPTTLDLKVLLDIYGGAVAFARVRSLTILNKSTTNGQIVTVAPGASNGWTNLLGASSTLILGPSTTTNAGFFAITNPSTTGWVVDATHKTLSLDPGANTISVDIEIMGASA